MRCWTWCYCVYLVLCLSLSLGVELTDFDKVLVDLEVLDCLGVRWNDFCQDLYLAHKRAVGSYFDLALT